jgi:hypothetical protein
MHRSSTEWRLAASFAATAVALLAACSQQPGPVPTAVAASAAHGAHAAPARHNNGELTPDQLKAIADVRKATTQFHDIEAAIQAGYSTQFPAGCAKSADGAQGFHYLNEGLVDANVELLRPELVMYEPGPNGQRNLVGVDYIVPLSLSETPPTLLGQEFAPLGPPLNVWALHIWAWRPNPSGMFALWNPKVSCAYEAIPRREK